MIKIKAHIALIVCGIILAKLAFVGISIGDSLATLFILASFQLSKFVDYKYPERPDLFKDVAESKSKIEELEREVTALKFGAMRK